MADGKQYNDTFVTFEGGMNAGVEPYLIPKTELANATNTTVRGGFVSPRPPFRITTLNFGGNIGVQNAVLFGNFQGSCYYKPDVGLESLIAAIGGRLFQFTISGTVANVIEITIPGDPNPASVAQAWLWQAENYVIWNDGVSVPVFFDGNTSRRSNTQSVQLAVTAVNFTIPAVGQPVTVTLTAPYTGPVPATIFIDNATYQTQLNAGGYTVNLKNLYDTAALHNVGEQVVQIPANLGYMTNTQPVPAGPHPAGTLLLTLVMSEPVDASLIGKKVLLGGAIWNIVAVSVPFNEIIIRNVNNFAGGVTFTPGTLITFSGSSPPNTVLGTLVAAAFLVPPIGTTAPAQMSVPFTGPPGTIVFIGTGQYAITGTPIPPPGVTITVINLNDIPGKERGPTINANRIGPGIFFSMPELPPSRMGAYGLGRNWMSLVDGRQFIGGDIVGGPSGTPALQNRDAVLRTTENLFLAGGGTFVVPGNVGNITSMTFSSTLDSSLGQGALQVGTPEIIFSCNAPVDRTVWASLTNPILTEALKGQGPLSQDSTFICNSDILFRSPLGAGSETLARRDYNTWGNTPISNEVSPIFDADDKTLLGFSTGMQFDNRALFSVAPTSGPQGVFHKGLVSIQLDTISNLAGKTPSVWEGLWTGINIFQMRQGLFSGVKRGFAFTYNAAAGQLELYELLPSADPAVADNGTVPIIWAMESPLMFRPQEADPNPPYLRLEAGELCVKDVVGRVDFKIQYRPDSDPCWHDWHEWSICGRAPNPLSPNPQPVDIQPQYRKPMGLPKPPDDCDEVINKPFREGFWFQSRLLVQGSCTPVRFRFLAVEIPRPKPAPSICGDEDVNNTGTDCPPCRTLECTIPDDLNTYSLNNGTLYQNVETSVVIPQPPGFFIVPAGSVKMVVPANPVSPLRLLSCQCEIVRDIEGKTPDEISVIAQEMVAEAAVQLGECRTQQPVLPFFNGVETITCDNGTLINLTGTPSLPPGVSFIDGHLVVAPGVITSTISQADADAKAISMLQSILANLMAQGTANCGFWNTAQTFCCEGGSPCTTVPPFTVFSQISQVDADAQALALAESTTVCGGVNVCIDGTTTLADNIYGIQDYDASLFALTPDIGCGSEWDGTFTFFDSGANSGTWYGSSGEFVGCVTINSASLCITSIGFTCEDTTPVWQLTIGSGWIGSKTGGGPEGIYTRTGGDSGTPATLTIILFAGVTGKSSQNCSS